MLNILCLKCFLDPDVVFLSCFLEHTWHQLSPPQNCGYMYHHSWPIGAAAHLEHCEIITLAKVNLQEAKAPCWTYNIHIWAGVCTWDKSVIEIKDVSKLKTKNSGYFPNVEKDRIGRRTMDVVWLCEYLRRGDISLASGWQVNGTLVQYKNHDAFIIYLSVLIGHTHFFPLKAFLQGKQVRVVTIRYLCLLNGRRHLHR